MKKIMIGAALVLGIGLSLSPALAWASEYTEGNNSAVQYVPFDASAWMAPVADTQYATGSGENTPTPYVLLNDSPWTTPSEGFPPIIESQSQNS